MKHIMYSHGCGNASIYAMYIYVYTYNSNNIITCIQDTQHTINRELYLSFDLRIPSTPEKGYDSIGEILQSGVPHILQSGEQRSIVGQ